MTIKELAQSQTGNSYLDENFRITFVPYYDHVVILDNDGYEASFDPDADKDEALNQFNEKRKYRHVMSVSENGDITDL